MALSDTDVRALYNGNGVTTNFAIPFSIQVNDSAETIVYIRDESDPDDVTNTLQVEGALQNYTLTGATPPTTPFDTTVVFNAGSIPTSNQKVLVIRVTPKTQILDMADSQATPLTSIELALDRLVAMIQELGEQAFRSPRYPLTADEEQPIIPEPVAGTLVGFNDAGTNLDIYTMDDLATALQSGGLLTAHTTTITNGATTSTVSEMLCVASSYKTYIIDYTIKRRTSTTSYNGSGKLICEYDERTTTWGITDVNFTSGHGVNFTISSSGQVGYSSDTIGGASYVSALDWRIVERFAADS